MEVRQSLEIRAWLDGVRDRRARERVAQRIVRLGAGLFGDAKFFDGTGGLRVDHGPGDRVYFVQRGLVLVVLLCGGDTSSRDRDIGRARALADRLEDWMVKTEPFDAARDLASADSQAELIADAVESGDPSYVAQALGVVAKARGLTAVAARRG